MVEQHDGEQPRQCQFQQKRGEAADRHAGYEHTARHFSARNRRGGWKSLTCYRHGLSLERDSLTEERFQPGVANFQE